MLLIKSKFLQDAVHYGEVFAGQTRAQPHQQISLFGFQVLAVHVKPVHNSDTAALTAAYSFQRVRKRQDINIVTDGSDTDAKLKRQIIHCFLPPVAESFHNFLASFVWPHRFSHLLPLLCSLRIKTK